MSTENIEIVEREREREKAVFSEISFICNAQNYILKIHKIIRKRIDLSIKVKSKLELLYLGLSFL